MRLRAIPLLVLIVALVAGLGAWTDRPKYKTEAPPVVAATKPWNAIVNVTRRGRPLDGYRAVVTLTGPRGTQHVQAQDLGHGKYRFHVRLPHGGFYSYTLVLYLLVSYRLKALQRENLLLERRVKERTHQIERQSDIIEKKNSELEQLSLVASKTEA